MPLQDTTAILNGYDQNITDWALGDDRIFTGQVAGLPVSDANLVLAFFTLKSNPNDADGNAILQKRINQTSQPSGVISIGSDGKFDFLLVHVYAGDYQPFVNAGTEYWWDFRIVSVLGITWTVAQGMVQFKQNSTQSNAAGTPYAIPSLGSIPSIRGFINANPNSIDNYALVDVFGDVYFNSSPRPAEASGWQCISSGSPGTWVTMGIVGDEIMLGPVTPPLAAARGGGVPIIRGFLDRSPVQVVGYNAIDIQGDVYFNSTPQPAEASGWQCVASGQPGQWSTMGIVGDNPNV